MRMMAFLGLFALLAAATSPLAGRDVVISEIQYHPHGDDPRDEYLEIENRGDSTVDLGGWFFVEGVTFRFPESVPLDPGEVIVVSPDRNWTIERYALEPERVLGNWEGRLENGGEILHLVDASGTSAFRVQYRDARGWPRLADGLGPSLELLPGAWDPYLPGAWRASAEPLGSPGRPIAPSPETFAGSEPLPRGAPWRYFEGRRDPVPDGSLAWTLPGFDDSSWPVGPEPLGYGSDAVATEIPDMWGNFTTLYARAELDLPEAELSLIETGAASFVLTLMVDDGAALFVNGIEVERINLAGAAGSPVPWDARADGSLSTVRALELSGPDTPLVAGKNTVAIAGANSSPFSGDFLLGVTGSTRAVDAVEAAVTIEEVRRSGGGVTGFVELRNRGREAADLAGYRLTDSPWRRDLPGFAPGTVLAAGERRAFSPGELGLEIPATPTSLLLLTPGGAIVDFLVAPGLASDRSLVRDPDEPEEVLPAEPTPGAVDQPEREAPIVINEISYNPRQAPDRDVSLEFVEILNRSAEAIPLDGWEIAGGVDFPFPAGTSIAPGGTLVVAADPAGLAAETGFSTALGPWRGRLDNGGETIRLRDPAGSSVDRVRYADEGSWPAEADGRGPTLELIHPSLDNRYGAAWAAGPVGGTPGQRNAAWSDEVPPRPVAVRHWPVVPRSDEPVRVACRVVDTGPVTGVELSWADDRQGGGDVAPMRDDGAAPDEVAGDGLWSGEIPPRGDGHVIRFEITADDGATRTTAPGSGRSFLYQVVDDPIAAPGVPHFSILMTRDNWREIRNRSRGSNVYLDGTFVDVARGETWYNVGVRYRGNGSRNPPDGRFSYRVRFGSEHPFHDVERLNLNAQNTHRQYLGNDLFRRVGLPYPLTVPVVLRLDDRVDRRYARVEVYDEDFLTRFFGRGDDGGNLYRGMNGRLDFRGGSPGEYNGRYRLDAGDPATAWSDLAELTRAFTLPDAEFVPAVEARIDVVEWALYFAANGALGNTENSILIDAGDDYFLYRRPSDDRFLIIPWDTDSVFTDDSQRLFRPSSSAVARFLGHPRYAPLYHCALERFRDLYMTAAEVGRRVERLAPLHRPQDLDSVLSFIPARQSFIDARAPRSLTVNGEGGSADLVVAPGDLWKYWKGTSHPSGGDLSWVELDFDDSAWPSGPSGFGYGDGDDATRLDDMQNRYSSVFTRRRFTLHGVERITSMTFRVDYDDGFVAWLNGEEIASQNWRGPPPGNRDTAFQDHEAGVPVDFPLDNRLDLLLEGDNVLAIIGLNGTLDSSDLTLIPSLEIERAEGAARCEPLRFVGGGTLRLSGEAPACGTSEVRVDGAPAAWTPAQATWRHTVRLDAGVHRVTVEAVDSGGAVLDSTSLLVAVRNDAARLEGSLSGPRVFRGADNPVSLSGEVVVEEGASLELGPGTVVLAEPGSLLRVRGTLRVQGTPEEPVVFRSSDCGASWGGIILEGSGAGEAHVLESCEFQGGAPEAAGMVSVRGARLLARDVTFRTLSDAALAVEGGEAELSGGSFLGCARGASVSIGTLTLADCRFEDIEAEAVSATGGETRLTGIEVRRAATGFAWIGGSHVASRCLLAGCATAIALSGDPAIALDHLTIVAGTTGIDAAGVSDGAGRRTLQSSIVWDNGAGVVASERLEITYCDVQDSAPPGEGNMSEDPAFNDPATDDWTLQAGSPAAGAGRDGSDMGAFIAAPVPSGEFLRGDADANGRLNLTDAVRTLLWLFQSGPEPPCVDAADTNDDGRVNLTDAVRTLNHLFRGGPAPAAPFPEPGADPTGDALGCGI